MTDVPVIFLSFFASAFFSVVQSLDSRTFERNDADHDYYILGGLFRGLFEAGKEIRRGKNLARNSWSRVFFCSESKTLWTVVHRCDVSARPGLDYFVAVTVPGRPNQTHSVTPAWKFSN